MKLRTKIPLLIGIVLLLLIVALYATLHLLTLRSFRALEEKEINRNLERVTDALQNEINRISMVAGDYAAWDDCYEFAATHSQKFISDNITPDALTNLNINQMAFFNLSGKFLFGEGVELKSGETAPMSPYEQATLREQKSFLTHDSMKSAKSGFMLSGSEILLCASRPIVTSKYTGPIRGTLYLSKKLDSSETRRISDIIHLPFIMHRLDSPLFAQDSTPFKVLNEGARTVVLPKSKDRISGYTLLRDYRNRPILLLELSIARDLFHQGKITLRNFVIALIIIGLLFAALVLVLLESQILRRLSRLSDDVQSIRKNTNLDARITLEGVDELGQLSGEINGMLENIEKANTDVRESEKKFRLTFESAKDAIFWIDPEQNTLINCNREAENLLKRTKPDILAQPPALLFPKEKEQENLRLIRIFFDKNENFETESDILTSSGSIKLCTMTGSVTWVSGKRIIQITLRDITLQRQAEKEREALEEQLRQSQKMEVIGQLAGGVAHDFNNMLSGISGYADLIRRKFGKENPSLEKYADTIFETSKSAAELTAKLLAFARKGKNELMLVSLHDIIQDVIKLLEHSIDKRIVIAQSLTADPCGVLGDRTQIQNAILNLGMNANDAMPDGGTLSFETELFTVDEAYAKAYPYKVSVGRYIKLSVTDTGIGMDEPIKAKLFTPFFTTKSVGKGTGLGLASVYGTIKSHQGHISVYSEKGHGTSFHLYLPLAIAGAHGKSPHLDQELAHKGTGRILLIDDEKLVREVTSEILRELGYEVETAVDGLAAIEWYQANHATIDLVMMDIIMPRVGGFDCFQELKKINPGIRCIVSSGYAMNTEAARILASGALLFIQKPFDMAKISRVIKQALA